MGCSMAYHLARRGVDVLLLERDTLASGSTSKNAGGVRQQFSAEINVRIQMLAVKMLLDFEAEIGVPSDFRQNGYLFLLTRPKEVVDFQALVEMWHRVGLSEATWLSPDDAQRMLPAVNVDDVLGCTFCHTDGIASPDAVTMGYANAARRHGARIREGVKVTGIDVEGGRVGGLRTTAGDFSTRVIFDCAGPWAEEIGRLAGVDVPVKPYRRHIFVTDGFPPIPRTTPFTIDFTSSFYFHPEGDGILFGMSNRAEPSTFSTAVDHGFAEDVMAAALQRVPALETAAIRTAWAGLYEVTPDHQAILGPAQGVEGFWCACGFSGHGFMQAPPAGLLLTQLLLDGKSDIDLGPLALSRFAGGGLRAEQNVV